MGNTPNRRRTVLAALEGVALVAALTACAAAGPDTAGSLAPTPTASPGPTNTPSPTPTPTWDPDASANFAAEVFPITGTDQYVVYNSGQLVAARESGTGTTTDTAPGTYELQLACRGGADNSITITAVSAGTGSAVLTAPCDERTRSVPFSMVNTGVTLTATGSGGDPVEWAAVLATGLDTVPTE